MMRKVLVGSRSFGEYDSSGKRLLEQHGFVVKRIGPELRPLNEEKLVRILADESPSVYICGAELLSERVLLATPDLKMVVKHGVGIDNIDLTAAKTIGIVVANAPGTNAAAVADLTITAMLVLLRKFCEACHSTKAGEWRRFLGHELGAITVGLLGMGRIGGEVAKRLHGFGSAILAYDVVRNDSLIERYGITYTSLEEVMQRADIVSLHLPLLPQTRKIISHRQLSLMKRSAYLVNLARGELVDEDALYEALKAGTIAGAALDVFTTEPPHDSPLLGLEQVVATPHIAAYTEEAMARMDRMCAEVIISVFSGGIPESVINPEAALNSSKGK